MSDLPPEEAPSTPTTPPTATTPPQQPARPGATRNRLFRVAMGMVAGLCVYYAYVWEGRDTSQLYQGLVMFVLAAVPTLQWAYRAETTFPLMEAFLLTSANTYALPLLTGHESLQLYPDTVISTTANAVIVYELCAILAYNLTPGRPGRKEFWTAEVISEEYSRFLSYGMTATNVYTFATTFFYDEIFSRLPRESEGILRAVFFGLSIICTFITCRRWGQGTIRRQEKNIFLVNLVLLFVFLASSLYLISGLSIITLALLGYISGSHKVPWLPLAVVIPVISVLHHGKSQMRDYYWTENPGHVLRFTELPSFYVQWFRFGLQREEGEKHATAKLLERTSLFHILCLVVSQTPERQPYLYGDTYRQIPGQFIPRFFWPDKPGAQVSTNRLSLYYGLQTEEDTKSTSIGFGMVSEAFANFGFLGVGLIGGFFGFAFKKVSVWTRLSPMLSYGGLLLVLLMAWSFQTELTLSVWLSSLFQACVAVLGTPFVLRKVLG